MRSANRPGPKSRIPAAVRALATARYLAGEPLKNIAIDTHVRMQTIVNWIKRDGLPLRRARSKPNATHLSPPPHNER